MKQTGLNKTVAWWLNTHPRKEETKEALNEIAGAWGGKPDSVLLLRMLDDDRTQLRFPKLRWAKRGKRPTILLAFDPDTEAFTLPRRGAEDERDYLAEIRRAAPMTAVAHREGDRGAEGKPSQGRDRRERRHGQEGARGASGAVRVTHGRRGQGA